MLLAVAACAWPLPVTAYPGSYYGPGPGTRRQMEQDIADGINRFRAEYGLPPVPVSPALTEVAEAHALDLDRYRPDEGSDPYGAPCTMHSWSSHGNWTPVCFTADNRSARSMWSKPREITHGRYRDNGFEIAYRYSDFATPELALASWRRSRAHATVILEQGPWTVPWRAMGVAIRGSYAVVWFGRTPDPAARSVAQLPRGSAASSLK